MYDVIVAGGSIAGLLCAREIAREGFSILVLEEDYEIGSPEHCSGLVSSTGLNELGVIPSQKTFEQIIESAEIFAPNKKSILINSKKQKIIEVSRRELDKQIALQAQKNGAEIRVNSSVQELQKNQVKVKDQTIKCKTVVDARGISSLIQRDRTGILASAQYEIYADWIQKNKVQIYFDQEKYLGFFGWIIPTGNGKGKVGVAGKAINPANALDEFLQSKGEYSVIRKVFAPIWVKGPIEEFVQNDIIIIGDAAGQTKPTTAGGIYTSGVGGILAGKAIAKYLKTHNIQDLKNYQVQWNEKFREEFEKQAVARKLLERADNNTINKIFSSITPEIIREISEKDDFDFHTRSIIKMLGLKGSIKTAQAVIQGEIKKLLG